MQVKNRKELFVLLLSNVRQSTERSAKLFQELSEAAQSPEIEEAFSARTFVTQKTLATLDEARQFLDKLLRIPVQVEPAQRLVKPSLDLAAIH